MRTEELTSERARFCEACWVELKPNDTVCPLCGAPARETGEEPENRSTVEESGGDGSNPRGASRQAIVATAIVAALLGSLVIWLNFQVNAFNKLRATERPVRSGSFAPPRAVEPPADIDRSVQLVDFAGRWRVTAGAEQTGSDSVDFELVMNDGELVAAGPVSADSPTFTLDDGLLRGEIQSGPTRLHLTASLLRGGREMSLWVDPPLGPIIEMKAERL